MFGRSNKRTIFILGVGTGIAVGLVAGIAIMWVMTVLFQEDLYTERGTLTYYITITSRTVKDLPQIGKVGEEQYYYSAGDGPKLPAEGVYFMSHEQPEVIADVLDKYLTSKGFVSIPSQSSLNDLQYQAKDSTFSVVMTDQGNGLHSVLAKENF